MSMGYKRCLSFFLSWLTFLAGVLYTIISYNCIIIGCFRKGDAGFANCFLHWLHHIHYLSFLHCGVLPYDGVRERHGQIILATKLFLSCRKKLFTAVHYFVHLNLAISLLLGYVVFMFGIELGTSTRV